MRSAEWRMQNGLAQPMPWLALDVCQPGWRSWPGSMSGPSNQLFQPLGQRAGQLPRSVQHRQNLHLGCGWQVEDEVVLEIRHHPRPHSRGCR